MNRRGLFVRSIDRGRQISSRSLELSPLVFHCDRGPMFHKWDEWDIIQDRYHSRTSADKGNAKKINGEKPIFLPYWQPYNSIRRHMTVFQERGNRRTTRVFKSGPRFSVTIELESWFATNTCRINLKKMQQGKLRKRIWGETLYAIPTLQARESAAI